MSRIVCCLAALGSNNQYEHNGSKITTNNRVNNNKALMAPIQFGCIKIEYFDSVGFEAFTIYIINRRLIIEKLV